MREGIIKHSRDYEPAEHPELAEYILELRPPLEAQLIDLADEIAYLTADLDDGLDSGILALEQVRESVPLFRKFYEGVACALPRRRAADSGQRGASPGAECVCDRPDARGLRARWLKRASLRWRMCAGPRGGWQR